MRIVYYDFYTDDFVLSLPPSASIVEIGIRKPRLYKKGVHSKYTPYLLATFQDDQFDTPLPVRFKAVPMHTSDRVNSEITIEGGIPKVGHQRSIQSDTRPIQLCAAYARNSTMILIGKLAIPNYSDLSDVDDRARDLLKNNATHLIYRETPLNQVGSSTVLSNTSTNATVDINDNNIARSF